jgi:small-conductance mechanosensitive channel
MGNALDWLAKSNFSFVSLIATVMVIVAAFITVTFINRLMAGSIRGLEQRLSLPEEALLGFTRVMKGIVWLIAALLILSLWGVSVSGLWTLLVTTATIIGVGFLAVWAMISNATANLFITIWRPFQLGDTVELLPENLKGRVIVRNLMFTVLREENGARLHVPNNLFFQKIFRVRKESGSPDPNSQLR